MRQTFLRTRGPKVYFGGAGVKISRRAGSGFGFGFGAFLASFLPLSLLPMIQSMTQKAVPGKAKTDRRASPGCQPGNRRRARVGEKPVESTSFLPSSLRARPPSAQGGRG